MNKRYGRGYAAWEKYYIDGKLQREGLARTPLDPSKPLYSKKIYRCPECGRWVDGRRRHCPCWYER